MASLIPLITQPGFWLAFALAALVLGLLAWRLRPKRNPAAWWPAVLLRVLLVGLVLLALGLNQLGRFNPQPLPNRQVMVVDQSDSLSAQTRQAALAQAAQWQAEGNTSSNSPGQKNRTIVVFGSQAQPILAGGGPSAQVSIPATGPGIDGRASDIAGAIDLAGSLLGGQPGQILLATDGLANSPQPGDQPPGDIGTLVAGQAAQGHSLEVVPLAPRPAKNDLALGSLVAPKHLWSGTPLDLLVPVVGVQPGAAPTLTLKVNGQDSQVTAEPVVENPASAAGSASGQLYHFQVPDLPEGMVTLEVTVASSDPQAADPFPGNNSAYAVVQVFTPPPVLLVTAQGGSEPVTRFNQALAGKKIQVDILSPDQLPTNLAALQQYRVIFLDDLLAPQLSPEQMTALQVFASRLGGGVVFIGGQNSYTLGGYEDTPLQAMLPVSLTPPPRTQRPPMVFQLVLDRSSSMGDAPDSSTGLGPTKMDLAREAAMRAIETLQAEDTLGVLTFSDDSNWDFPLQPLGKDGIRQALDAVSRVQADGSTYMYKAMQDAINAMVALPADSPTNRHILLLTDGQSTDGSLSEYITLAKEAHDQGITISTIALGSDADVEVLQQIAEAGQGRFYAVLNANDLPRILVTDSRAARSENIQQGKTSLKAVDPGHPFLSGLNPDQIPALQAYNALQSRVKEGAEDILVSENFGDPVLSAWQYGLGRVAAWTGDLGEEWAADPASVDQGSTDWNPDNEGAFWAQVVRYMLVDPGQSPAQANVQVLPDRLLVDAAIDTPAGEPLNLAEVKFTFAGADGQNTTYKLVQNSAGRYQAEIPRPPDGAYRAILSYPGEDGQAIEVPAPFAVNPPAEWQPPDAAAGKAALSAWAKASGGQVVPLTGLDHSQQPIPQSRLGFLADRWWLLLLALVVLWPLEIAFRRRWLPWRW